MCGIHKKPYQSCQRSRLAVSYSMLNRSFARNVCPIPLLPFVRVFIFYFGVFLKPLISWVLRLLHLFLLKQRKETVCLNLDICSLALCASVQQLRYLLNGWSVATRNVSPSLGGHSSLSLSLFSFFFLFAVLVAFHSDTSQHQSCSQLSANIEIQSIRPGTRLCLY